MHLGLVTVAGGQPRKRTEEAGLTQSCGKNVAILATHSALHTSCVLSGAQISVWKGYCQSYVLWQLLQACSLMGEKMSKELRMFVLSRYLVRQCGWYWLSVPRTVFITFTVLTISMYPLSPCELHFCTFKSVVLSSGGSVASPLFLFSGYVETMTEVSHDMMYN